jgi:two-component system cell cycle sensor histidine kinase/response regulator CckA
MERADLEQWKAREVARLLALLETERRYYQEIVAYVPVGIMVLSSELAVISANRAIRKIFGLRSGEALRRVESLLPPEVLRQVPEVLRTGIAQTGILGHTEQPSARRLRVGIQVVRNWDEVADPEALLTIEDLTDLEPAPAAAQEDTPAGLPAAALLDHLDAVVWALELPSFGFVFASRQAADLSGYPVEHWLNTPGFFRDRIHPEDRDSVLAGIERAIEQGVDHAAEFRVRTADGRVRWVRENMRLLPGPDGQAGHLLGITADITERRALEDQLVQTERIDAISRLAARMAHDLNNLLMIVNGYGEELLRSLGASSPQRADLQEILQATGRVGTLSARLVEFTKPRAVTPSSVDLAKLLPQWESALREQLGPGIDLKVLHPEHPVPARAAAAQLGGLVALLAGHAHASMHGSGRMVLSASTLEIAEDLRRPLQGLPVGVYGVIALEHSGSPLPSTAAHALLEDFLPRKDEGELALWQAYSLLRQAGGDLRLTGGEYRVYLPLSETAIGEAPPPLEADAEPAVEAPAPTILVAEDEPGIRALVRKILRRQGYQVLEASDGEEALRIIHDHSGAIHLLITDVMMPGLGGPGLASQLREQRPDTKLLFISGYTGEAPLHTGDLPEGTAFLQKPFTLGSLLDRVKELLK